MRYEHFQLIVLAITQSSSFDTNMKANVYMDLLAYRLRIVKLFSFHRCIWPVKFGKPKKACLQRKSDFPVLKAPAVKLSFE